MNIETGTDRPVRRVRGDHESVVRLVIGGSRGNIISCEVIETLLEELAAVREDPGVSLVTIEGAGRNFSFGASVEEHLPDEIGRTLPALHRLVLDIASSELPVAALVRGRCLGGAFELVAACHFVFAGQDARFALPEVKLGVFPPAGCALLPERIGPAFADRLVLTGEELDASALSGTGWITAILHDDDLFEHVLDWHRTHLAPLSRSSLRLATRAVRIGFLRRLRRDLPELEALYLEELVSTEDADEGIAAFLGKRDPVWKHR